MCCNNFNSNVKIFISYHKLINKLEFPFIEMIPTDLKAGTNIASKCDYCELRTQYYVWKNCIPEYVGFFQFRRYLDISSGVCNVNSKKKPRPYVIKKFPEIKDMSVDKILGLKEKYDVIAPIPEYTGVSVYNRYAVSKGHKKEDLDMAINILLDKYPYFKDAVEVYLNGVYEYYGNMFFMKKNIYEDYCSWLFDIMFTFDQKVLNVLPKTNGYLGERLFGIYFTYLKLQDKLFLGELPRVHFSCYDDKNHNFRKEKVINFLLPSGSKRKAMVRKVVYLWRKKFKIMK